MQRCCGGSGPDKKRWTAESIPICEMWHIACRINLLFHSILDFSSTAHFFFFRFLIKYWFVPWFSESWTGFALFYVWSFWWPIRTYMCTSSRGHNNYFIGRKDQNCFASVDSNIRRFVDQLHLRSTQSTHSTSTVLKFLALRQKQPRKKTFPWQFLCWFVFHWSVDTRYIYFSLETTASSPHSNELLIQWTVCLWPVEIAVSDIFVYRIVDPHWCSKYFVVLLLFHRIKWCHLTPHRTL